MQITTRVRRTDSPSSRLAPSKQFLYADKPPSADGKSNELKRGVEVLCNPHHGQTQAEAEWCVRRAARWCVKHRKFDDLEWLSRRGLEVDTSFGKLRDEAALDLSDGELNGEDLAFLKAWLAQRKDNVPLTLSLACNDFSDARCGQNLTDLLSEPAIVVLDVTECELSSDGVKQLCNVIASNSTLTTLHLGNNDSDDWGRAVGDMLKSNTTLVKLDLDGCQLDADDFERIGRALEGNSSLKQLHLHPPLLTDPARPHTGIYVLLTSLGKRETSMQYLGLPYCCPPLNRDGCLEAMVQLLRRPSGLQGLSLAGWPMDVDECSLLNEALCATRTLVQLDLSRSDVFAKDERKARYDGLHQGLCEALRNNPKLVTLKLNGWHLGPELIDSLNLLLRSKTCRLKTLELKVGSRKSKKKLKDLQSTVARNLSLVSFLTGENSSKSKRAELNDQHVAQNMRRQTRLLAPAAEAFNSMMGSQTTPTVLPGEILQEITHWIDRIGGPTGLQNVIIAAVNRDKAPESSFCE